MDFPINRYFSTEPQKIKTLDLCRGDDDFRKVYIVTIEEKKIVIKHCSNTFTDENRINGWSRLMDAYRALGIYCPAILPGTDGQTVYRQETDGRTYFAWAEEFAPYRTAEQIGEDTLKDADGIAVYAPELFRLLGTVAAAKLDLMDWPSAYCLLEPFCPPDTTDEQTECAEKFVKYVKENIPRYTERAERLLELYYKVQSELRKVYPLLPTSCFQGDLNESNLLLDDENHFVGLIDFNLCGKEPILNYTVREALWWTDDSALYGENQARLYFYDKALDDLRIRSFLKNMAYIGERYRFTEIEREIFPTLFRYVNSFWWHHVSAVEEVKDDDEKLEMLFDWLEKQLTREDIRLP